MTQMSPSGGQDALPPEDHPPGPPEDHPPGAPEDHAPGAPADRPSSGPPDGSAALAAAALVLGICSCLIPVLGIVLGIVGIILGSVSLARRREGKGLAVAGVVMAALGIIVWVCGSCAYLFLSAPRYVGPATSFFGQGGNAHHVCYVVDRSGSMVDSFDSVRREMLLSIGRLEPVQDFHVILFAEGPPVENKPGRLVTATARHKQEAARFLESVRADGTNDPIPALERAFEILSKADPDRPGKLIYLLTDGNFPDNAAVVNFIRKRNRRKDVKIHTCLLGACPTEAVTVMTDIAAENGGRYKNVEADE